MRVNYISVEYLIVLCHYGTLYLCNSYNIKMTPLYWWSLQAMMTVKRYGSGPGKPAVHPATVDL